MTSVVVKMWLVGIELVRMMQDALHDGYPTIIVDAEEPAKEGGVYTAGRSSMDAARKSEYNLRRPCTGGVALAGRARLIR